MFFLGMFSTSSYMNFQNSLLELCASACMRSFMARCSKSCWSRYLSTAASISEISSLDSLPLVAGVALLRGVFGSVLGVIGFTLLTLRGVFLTGISGASASPVGNRRFRRFADEVGALDSGP